MQFPTVLWAAQDPQDRHTLIVSSRGIGHLWSTTVLTRILKPLVGKSPPHIHNTQDIVRKVNKVTLQPGECLSSYDVTDLFTMVPVEPALDIIKGLLEQDSTLQERTVLPVKDTILLLGFCLHNTYSSFHGQFYEQVEGVAMRSPVSLIMANLFMEHLEQKALGTATNPLRLWLRYVDDTFVIHMEVHTNRAS